ncbi:MAG: hypothetical protein K2M91_04120 [Lachnospiraceae bacterium]|nr:hypothetical protein [Lachnospiraceae bacterium]
MYAFLGEWCYFILLDRSGVHTVKTSLPELETDKNGQVSALAISEYMERKADE